jgi:hypothetical protein
MWGDTATEGPLLAAGPGYDRLLGISGRIQYSGRVGHFLSFGCVSSDCSICTWKHAWIEA